ncbi:Uncaracterized surface protein containing fasciclin (FAS1) repeats [Sulfitobacter brevis]|uniref:Uncaracterized surface protein containing fasciclin (FAS1) repeats n=1 Tax=Sulfitobacter brevis TaxID=74348 RepID=A0A1I2DAH1_9RHOB|nr:fasciclin domain-containing protein [Sulfitobacter brevis]SFE77514.1 Uncaracterized surface protein containing fasciclin (FAS1) repeats [Sulfitobacter brevis]
MYFAKSMMTAAVIAVSAGAVHAAENPMVGGAEMFAIKNIVENAVNSADHTTLVAAVQAAGLAETLSGAGPFTVFAPTNDAFGRLEAGAVDNLLKPENKEQLQQVLTCHVVSDTVMGDALKSLVDDNEGHHPLATLGGCMLDVTYADDGRILLTDENGNGAFVEIADVAQSNGVIHVIDGVMLPKQ